MTPPERPSFVLKKEAKTLSAPTGQLQTTHLSINALIEQQREWKTIAHAEKLNGNDQVFHIMIKRDPQAIDAVKYHFEVDSAMQKTRLDNAMSEIIPKLRRELQNYDLDIAIEVTKDEVEEVKFLTGNDRFEKMAKKNSNLFDFRNRFNLDIEY